MAAISVSVLMIPYSLGSMSESTLTYMSTILVSIAAVYTLYSGAEYLCTCWQYVRQLLMCSSTEEENT